MLLWQRVARKHFFVHSFVSSVVNINSSIQPVTLAFPVPHPRSPGDFILVVPSLTSNLQNPLHYPSGRIDNLHKMLNWLKGGPPTAYASEDAMSSITSNDHEPPNRNMNTTPQDEDAFTDTSSGEEGN